MNTEDFCNQEINLKRFFKVSQSNNVESRAGCQEPCWKVFRVLSWFPPTVPLKFYSRCLLSCPLALINAVKAAFCFNFKRNFQGKQDSFRREVTATCNLDDPSLSFRFLAGFCCLSCQDQRNWKGINVFQLGIASMIMTEPRVMKNFIICGLSPSAVWQHPNAALSCSSSHSKSSDWGSLIGALCPAPCQGLPGVISHSPLTLRIVQTLFDFKLSRQPGREDPLTELHKRGCPSVCSIYLSCLCGKLTLGFPQLPTHFFLLSSCVCVLYVCVHVHVCAHVWKCVCACVCINVDCLPQSPPLPYFLFLNLEFTDDQQAPKTSYSRTQNSCTHQSSSSVSQVSKTTKR